MSLRSFSYGTNQITDIKQCAYRNGELNLIQINEIPDDVTVLFLGYSEHIQEEQYRNIDCIPDIMRTAVKSKNLRGNTSFNILSYSKAVERNKRLDRDKKGKKFLTFRDESDITDDSEVFIQGTVTEMEMYKQGVDAFRKKSLIELYEELDELNYLIQEIKEESYRRMRVTPTRPNMYEILVSIKPNMWTNTRKVFSKECERLRTSSIESDRIFFDNLNQVYLKMKEYNSPTLDDLIQNLKFKIGE